MFISTTVFFYLEFLTGSFSKSTFYFSGPFLYALCSYFGVIHHSSCIDSCIPPPPLAPRSPVLCNECGQCFLTMWIHPALLPYLYLVTALVRCSRGSCWSRKICPSQSIRCRMMASIRNPDPLISWSFTPFAHPFSQSQWFLLCEGFLFFFSHHSLVCIKVSLFRPYN